MRRCSPSRPLAAWLPEARLLVHDEVGGVSLEDAIADASRAADAVRATARALAALHQLDVVAPERPQMDRVAPERLAMSVARLQATRPDLSPAAADPYRCRDRRGNVEHRTAAGGSRPWRSQTSPRPFRWRPGGAARSRQTRRRRADVGRRGHGDSIRPRPLRQTTGPPRAADSPVRGDDLAHTPAAWADRLPPHYAAALLHEAATAGESVGAGGEGDRPGRRARQAEYLRRLIEAAQAALRGDVYGWER